MTKPTTREVIGERWFTNVIGPELDRFAESMRSLAPAADSFCRFVTTTPAEAIRGAVADSIARFGANEA